MSKLEHPIPLDDAISFATELMAELSKNVNVTFTCVAGSVRRRKPVIKDLDIIVVTRNGVPGRSRIERGEIRNVPYQAHWCAAENLGAMLLFLTGSHEFNIYCRFKAKELGMRLNQYGLWRSSPTDDELVAATEIQILTKLGLQGYIDPENRSVDLENLYERT